MLTSYAYFPHLLNLSDADFLSKAHWGWISAAGWAGVEISDFPNLKAWEERMWERDGVKKGASVPDPYRMKELLADKERMEKHAKESRAWVQQGMKDDAEKNKARSSK